jgi:hypothetical protein
MNITVNIKPRKMVVNNVWATNMYAPVAATKASIMNLVRNNGQFCSTFCNVGNGLTRLRDDSTIRVYNLEKRRPVVKMVTDKNLLKKGIKRQVVTPGHWVAHVYDFDTTLLKSSGLRVEQGTRTFKIVKAK